MYAVFPHGTKRSTFSLYLNNGPHDILYISRLFFVYALAVNRLGLTVTIHAGGLLQLFLVRKFGHISVTILAGNRTVHESFVITVALETIIVLECTHRGRRKEKNRKNKIGPNHSEHSGE
jgi:hypothetical protein